MCTVLVELLVMSMKLKVGGGLKWCLMNELATRL